ncbi:MAG TPA: IclR family transcriptional regulator [Chloroflexota bacterium]|jgi:DNA-binding IclR family transcriptional regulator|nr:IclR family transcriptional regulator [Chloroflexota bacterium]
MRNGVEAVHRAVDVLNAFSRREPELTLAAVARKASLPKPTAFRILATLRARGLVTQDPATGQYSLGFGLLELASIRTQQTSVREEALPTLKHLRDALGETAVLSVRVGEYRVHLEQAEGTLPIRRHVEMGERVPLCVGGASKVLLAGLPDAEIQEYLARTTLTPYGPNTPTDVAKLLADVALIRRQGYAEGVNERNLGGVGVAAPVLDHAGAVVAALHVSVPQFRYHAATRKRCIAGVVEGARAISERLGYAG